MSSISGSESESEDSDSDGGETSSNPTGTDNESSANTGLITGRLFSKVVFQNSSGQNLLVYRCILQGKVSVQTSKVCTVYVMLLIFIILLSVPVNFQSDDEQDAASSLMSIGKKTMWIVLMTGGGHFAGAVFQG